MGGQGRGVRGKKMSSEVRERKYGGESSGGWDWEVRGQMRGQEKEFRGHRKEVWW